MTRRDGEPTGSSEAGPSVVTVGLRDRPYDVVVGTGILERIGALRSLALPTEASRALVVTQESVVAAGHVAPVEDALRSAGLRVEVHLVPDGEEAKEVSVLADIWSTCAALPLRRDDLVVAVGGGVVGDLAGFAAATYNRGVAVLQVPTTLLAQVDAAIGGKTGINLGEGKNLVGAFHQPIAVACDIATLATLTPRLRTEGFGEIVKYGLIADPHILDLLEGDPGAAMEGEADLLRDLVHRSAEVKAGIVAADEREGGVRTFLNLGHTYGHAVEALTGYAQVLHGEAVAIGTVVALRLGVRLGHTPADVAERGEALLERLGLPTRGPALSRSAIWEVMGRDKKAGRSGLRFVVLAGLADPIVVVPDRSDVDAVLDELAG